MTSPNDRTNPRGLSWSPTPDPDASGNDEFTVTVTDPDGNTGVAGVAIEVRSVNDAPVARDDNLAIALLMPVTLSSLMPRPFFLTFRTAFQIRRRIRASVYPFSAG